MPSLRSELHDLAAKFASDVLAAIRSASVDDILAESDRSSVRRGRAQPAARRAMTDRAASAILEATPAVDQAKLRGRRLTRRSAGDIAKRLGDVVTTLRATRGKGMRSEEIQKALKLDKRELPRVLKHGLATKKLRSKGQKRATRYFVG